MPYLQSTVPRSANLLHTDIVQQNTYRNVVTFTKTAYMYSRLLFQNKNLRHSLYFVTVYQGSQIQCSK